MLKHHSKLPLSLIVSETWHLNMDIHPRSRINYFRLCFNNCRLAGFPSGEYDLYVFSTKVFSCVIQMTVQHNKKAREYFLFCLLRSPFVFARGFRTNLEQAEKNWKLWPNNAKKRFVLHSPLFTCAFFCSASHENFPFGFLHCWSYCSGLNLLWLID